MAKTRIYQCTCEGCTAKFTWSTDMRWGIIVAEITGYLMHAKFHGGYCWKEDPQVDIALTDLEWASHFDQRNG